MQYEKNEPFSVSQGPPEVIGSAEEHLHYSPHSLRCSVTMDECLVSSVSNAKLIVRKQRCELILNTTSHVSVRVHSLKLKFKTKSYLKRHGYNHEFILPWT